MQWGDRSRDTVARAVFGWGESLPSSWPYRCCSALRGAAGLFGYRRQWPPRPRAGAFNHLAVEIDKSVTELGYPKEVGQDLVRLVRDWKCEVWQQAISQARQKYQQKQISPADVARVEEAVIQGLFQTIGKRDCSAAVKKNPRNTSICPRLSKTRRPRASAILNWFTSWEIPSGCGSRPSAFWSWSLAICPPDVATPPVAWS